MGLTNMNKLPEFLKSCTAFKSQSKEPNGPVKIRKATAKELEAYKDIVPSTEDAKFVYNKQMKRSDCK